MTRIIIDTKIIFSALVNKNSKIATFLLNSNRVLVMPKSGIAELFRQKENICTVSKHSQDEIIEILYELMEHIEFFDDKSLSTNSLQSAWEFVHDSDPTNMMFVASTLEINGLLWTDNNKLRKNLKNKGFNSFFTLN